MYMVAGEIKQICEKYGEFCSEYGILEKNNPDQPDESDQQNDQTEESNESDTVEAC